MSSSKLISFTNCPDFLLPGDSFTPVVTFQNTGTDTWSDSQNYHVGFQHDLNLWGWIRVDLPYDVLPGMQVSVPLPSTAPPRTSRYYQSGFNVQMVHDGVAWFGDAAQVDIVGMLPLTPAPLFNRPSPDLVGLQVFNTGPFVSNAKIRHTYWNNETGNVLRITNVIIWEGVDAGCPQMDTYCRVNRFEDGSILAPYFWDHYAQPNFPAQVQFPQNPPAILNPGESLELETYGGTTFHNHFLVWVQCAL